MVFLQSLHHRAETLVPSFDVLFNDVNLFSQITTVIGYRFPHSSRLDLLFRLPTFSVY